MIIHFVLAVLFLIGAVLFVMSISDQPTEKIVTIWHHLADSLVLIGLIGFTVYFGFTFFAELMMGAPL